MAELPDLHMKQKDTRMRRNKKGNPARVDTWPRRDVSTNYAGSTKVAARRLPLWNLSAKL